MYRFGSWLDRIKGSLQYSDQDLDYIAWFQTADSNFLWKEPYVGSYFQTNDIYQYYFQVGTGNEKVQMNLENQEVSNQNPDKKKKLTQEKDEEEKSSNVTIIVVVIVLILIILIALAAFLYKRKYSQVPQTDPAKWMKLLITDNQINSTYFVVFFNELII